MELLESKGLLPPVTTSKSVQIIVAATAEASIKAAMKCVSQLRFANKSVEFVLCEIKMKRALQLANKLSAGLFYKRMS